METLSLAEVAAAVGGRFDGPADTPVVGPEICIDSRAVTPGALFVALPGERVDGHRFVAQALADGAHGALVAEVPEGVDASSCVVVDAGADGLGVRRALGRLARHLVDGLPDLHTIALTGSQGKTSTKDLLAAVLDSVGPTVAPQGSHNNEIGVPLTAGACDSDTAHLVVEMGARGRGHISYLCGITPPDVAMVLNVGVAHLGEFGSREAIAEAKGEIVEALSADGWAVLNGIDPHTRAMADRTRGRIAFFSGAGRPDTAADLIVWADDVHAGSLDRHHFTLVIERTTDTATTTERAAVELRLSGRHQVHNATAAAAAAATMGVPIARIATALSAAVPRSRWRMEVTRAENGLVVCNDAYNANPDSMLAALQSLAAIGRVERAEHPGSRTIAVLGDMLELGEAAPAEHEAMGRAVAALTIDVLIAVGEHAEDLIRGARAEAAHEVVTHRVEDAAGAAELAKSVATRHDVVLVKASRSVALESVADALLTPSAEGCGPRTTRSGE